MVSNSIKKRLAAAIEMALTNYDGDLVSWINLYLKNVNVRERVTREQLDAMGLPL